MLGAPDAADLPLEVHELTVHYNDGTTRKVPIGEIRIVGYEREGLLEFLSAGGSSNGTGGYSVRAAKPVELVKVDYSFSDRLHANFRLALGGESIDEINYPLKLAVGDILPFTYEWLQQSDDPTAYEEYGIKLHVYLRTADGRTAVETLPVSRNVYLSEEQVKRLVRAGGERP